MTSLTTEINTTNLNDSATEDDVFIKKALNLILYKNCLQPEKTRLDKLFKKNIKRARYEVMHIQRYFKDYYYSIHLTNRMLINCDNNCWNCQFIKYNGKNKFTDNKGFPIKCENESVNKHIKNANDMLYKFSRR